MLHVTPPMTAPDVVANCKQLVTPTGFVDVDQMTLQHNKYTNVFSIGDSACAPNSKTAAAAGKIWIPLRLVIRIFNDVEYEMSPIRLQLPSLRWSSRI